jgi:hypothetical protein
MKQAAIHFFKLLFLMVIILELMAITPPFLKSLLLLTTGRRAFLEERILCKNVGALKTQLQQLNK